MNRRDFFKNMGMGIVAAPAIVYTATSVEPVKLEDAPKVVESPTVSNYVINITNSDNLNAESLVKLMSALHGSA